MGIVSGVEGKGKSTKAPMTSRPERARSVFSFETLIINEGSIHLHVHTRSVLSKEYETLSEFLPFHPKREPGVLEYALLK